MSLLTVAKVALKAVKWGALVFGTAYVCVEMQEKIGKAIDEARKEQAKVVEARGYSEAIADKVEIVVKVIKEAGAEVFAIVTSLGTLYGYEWAVLDRAYERRVNNNLIQELKRTSRRYQVMAEDCYHNYGRQTCYTDAGTGFNSGCAAAYFDTAKDLIEITKKYGRRTK